MDCLLLPLSVLVSDGGLFLGRLPHLSMSLCFLCGVSPEVFMLVKLEVCLFFYSGHVGGLQGGFCSGQVELSVIVKFCFYLRPL